MLGLKFLEEVPLKSISDARGTLSISESLHFSKFQVRRIYYISHVPRSEKRGSHAHKELQQLFFAITGAFSLKVTDGQSTDLVTLTANSSGYYMPAGLWRDLFNFTDDASCLVLASHVFNPDDYIYSYEEFLSWKGAL